MEEKRKNKSNVPNLRFPGFEGEWKLDKLGNLATNKSKKFNPSKSSSQIKCIELEHISSNDGKLLGHVDGSKSGSIKNVFFKGNVLFGKLRPYLRKFLHVNFDGVCSSEIWVMTGNRISNPFLYQLVQTDKFIDAANQSTGSKMPRADWKVVENTIFSFPSENEQEKISNFLALLNERIETQSKIIEDLNALRNTITKKIFSKKLRFKNEDGCSFPDWEEPTLGDVGKVRMCKRIFNEETSPIGEVPFFKIGSFGKEADAFISKKQYLDYRQRFSYPKKGDVLISAAGTIGRTVVYNGEEAYYQDSNIVWIDNDNTKVNNKFLYYILQIVKYNTEGGTIQRLYNSILKSIKFQCPNLQEQEKITEFLCRLDKKIETEIRILTNYRDEKKYLSQNLFI